MLDLDGTICLGDDPVLAYATAIDAAAGAELFPAPRAWAADPFGFAAEHAPNVLEPSP